MNNKFFFELHQNHPRQGPGRDQYTKKAYQMIPKVDRPHILDIGCGSGAPTIALAKLSGGTIIGLDIHQTLLDELAEKIKQEHPSDRITLVNQSMFEMRFPQESFDIIWSEGSIYIIGFERGLQEWKQFIKPEGYLVVHEMCWLQSNPPKEIKNYWERLYSGITTIPKNITSINTCGYHLLGHFTLPEDAWWYEYYEPLQKKIDILREKYKDDVEALSVLDSEQEEIDLYKKYSRWYGSVFYVMQKKEKIS